MQDQLADILAYVKGVINHKWVIVIFAWVICIAGWIYIHNMPDKYKSEARVQVDTRTMLRPLMRGLAVQSDVRGLIAIMKKLMFTQQNLLKVAELAGMEGDYETDKGRYAITNQLREGAEISGGRGEIFSISYESSSPIMAQKIVQAILSVFSEQTQQSTLSDMGAAQRFIDDQIREYEQRLRNAEKARENFKRINLGLLPGENEDQVSKIQTIRSEIEQIKMTISEMNAKKRVLQIQLDEALESDEEWGLTDLTGQGTEEDSKISNLQEQMDNLLLKYTKNHPDVKAINATIKELKQRKAEKEGMVEKQPSLEAMSNPYVQSIKIQINQVDAEIATLTSRAKMYKARLDQTNEEFNARLAVETEMQNLNRDYASIKSNYLNLIERREQASLSEKVDAQASALKLKIADPANRPLNPTAPNRELLYSVVLGIGLVIGLGVALLLVLIRPVFTSARNLRAVTGLPVLGTVSKFMTDEQIKKQKINNFMFFSASFLLIVAYCCFMVSEILF